MFTGLALLSSVSALVIFALSLATLLRPHISFWPPQKGNLQHRRRFLWLFRTMLYPLIAASMLHVWQVGLPSVGIAIVGMLLWTAGFGLAFAATLQMGWSNAFGSDEKFVCTGLFAYLRHPAYSTSFLGMIGWTLLVPHPLIILTLALWAGFYVIAMVLEEDYLLSRYGKQYALHMQHTTRFAPRIAATTPAKR